MPENAEADLLWGVTKIAAAIGRSQAATYYLLEKGDLPARKVRGRWVASRARLLAALTGHDAPAAA